MTARPSPKVEVAFANAPNDTVLTWTDISAWVDFPRGITITRGRADEMGNVPPARLQLTLDNSDGRFTPGKASSPHYPNVLPRKRIRVTDSKPGGGTSVRFTGFVVDWPLSWPRGGQEYAATEIVAYDRFSQLDRDTLHSPLTEELLTDNPVGYWPLTEASTSSSAGDMSNTGQPALTPQQYGEGGTLTFGSGASCAGDDAGTVDLAQVLNTAGTTTTGARWLGAALSTPVVGAAGVTVHVLAKAVLLLDSAGHYDLDRNGGCVWTMLNAARDRMLALHLGCYSFPFEGRDGFSRIVEIDPAVGGTGYQELPVSTAGSIWQPRSIVFTLTAAGVGTTYLDGVQVRQDAGFVSPFPLTEIRVGFQWLKTLGFTGAIGHLAIYEGVASTARIQAWAAAAATGFAGDRSDQRAARVLDWAGIPSGDRLLDVGSLTLGHLETDGDSPAKVLGAIAEAEPGRAFAAGDGRVVFHGRHHSLNRAPVATLTADQVDGDLQWDGDPSRIINEVSASRPQGATVKAVDAASVAAYGAFSTSVTVPTSTDAELAAHADWLAHRASSPVQRIRSVSLDLLTLPDALVAGLLTAELGDVITITGLPSQSPSSSVTLTLEGWTEAIGPDHWTIVANASPTDPTNYLQLDDPTYGAIGSTFVLASY